MEMPFPNTPSPLANRLYLPNAQPHETPVATNVVIDVTSGTEIPDPNTCRRTFPLCIRPRLKLASLRLKTSPLRLSGSERSHDRTGGPLPQQGLSCRRRRPVN
uniref:Uncharacterized protein n=1 Tax=Branchiostoma floridae TaxID=7739 RepID=C3Y1E0_BRAFL|eukprot:XP_002609670.1 hypothetical protein BRAFLDRAFT_83674 [Branchiostoma floridae]